MKKTMFIALINAISIVLIIMTYVGFRSMWFADTAIEFAVGAITMIGFGCGIVGFGLNIGKLYDWINNEES